MAKHSRHLLQDYYANIRGLLTQLELYHPYTIDRMTQGNYQEELIVVIFLISCDTQSPL